MTLVEYMQEEGMTLTRKGLSYWCSCPFHADDTPSMQVSPKGDGYVWYCFSCKRGGGPASFISDYKGIPKHQAKKVWDRLNGKEEAETDRDLLTSLVESMAVNGHPYLRERGISDDTCRAFGIGYCEDYGKVLSKFGLEPAYAAQLGLFDFTGCLIYPFYDPDGVYKVAARTLDKKGYKNSDKASRWHRDGLWGLELLRGDTAWVFEGYHDAMVARQHGYQSVAAAGTNMTKAMWDELRGRGVTRVVFAPDGDGGGRRWLEALAVDAPQDVCVEFVALEHGDPDDAIASGEFQGLPAVVPFEWFVSRREAPDLASKVRLLREASPVFLRMPKSQRVLCREWFKERFGDDEALDYLSVDVEPDYASERVVLANCLYSKSARLEAVRDLDDRHFHGRTNSNVWALVKAREATPQMVEVELHLDYSDYADLINYRYYIDRVRDVGTKISVSKILSSASPSDIGGTIEALYGAVDGTSVSESQDLCGRLMEDVNRRVNDPKVLGVPIKCLPALNKTLLGLVPGRLILLSGNSGHGKTTLACNIVNDVIDEYETLFVTLEMTDLEILEKLACIRSGIPSVKVQTGSLEQFEYDQFLEAVESISKSKLHVIDGVSDLHKIVALVRGHAMRKKTRFVVIDYAQLITVRSEEERWEQLAHITKTLKMQLAKKLGITVIALSQLKASALRSDVPDAADQAGAYAMLADADHAVTARKMDPKETKDGSNYLIHVSKNRFGLDSVVLPAVFDRQTQRIHEVGG